MHHHHSITTFVSVSLLSQLAFGLYQYGTITTESPLYDNSNNQINLKFVTTTTQSPLENDVTTTTTTVPSEMTTQSSARLEDLLIQCEPDESGGTSGEESSPKQQSSSGKILQYVEAMKDDVIQGNSTEQQFVRKELRPEEGGDEPEEVYQPVQMVKSYEVADYRDLNQIDEDARSGYQNLLQNPQPAPQSHRQPIKAAVFTRYSVEARPYSEFGSGSSDNYDFQNNEISSNEVEPQIIEVVSGQFRPLEIHFKSTSRRIKVVNRPPERVEYGEPEVTRSEEEPQRLIHTVRKPIISEVHEIITPVRKIIQEIHPVTEHVQTIVSSRRAGANKFNDIEPRHFADQDLKPPRVVHQQQMNFFTTASPLTHLPIVESLADVENQILAETGPRQQSNDHKFEPQLRTSPSTNIERLVRSVAPSSTRKPLFSANLFGAFLKPKNGVIEASDDVVYRHLRSRKYRRNVTIKNQRGEQIL